MKLTRGVTRGVEVHTEYPFGKDSLRSDGSQWSDEAVDTTGTTATWVDVESVTIEPPGGGGVIVEVELGVTWAQKHSSTGAFVNGRVVGRNKDGTWVVLIDTGTSPATSNAYVQGGTTSTTYAEHTYSGRFETETNFNTVPFDLAVQIQREDTTGTATAKVKNNSYVTVRYR